MQPDGGPRPTSLLTPAAAQVVALRRSLLKLLDLLGHGHVDRLFLCRFLLVARRQVERFGHCGAAKCSGLRWKAGGAAQALRHDCHGAEVNMSNTHR